MIITVSGLHGTGKSTYAARIASTLGLRHVSAGLLFRKVARDKRLTLEKLGKMALRDPSIDKLVDEKTIAEAAKGSVVIDGQLTGWILKDKSDLRIYLTAPKQIRLERIARRDKVDLKDAESQTKQRESIQRERYLKHYGFHVRDLSIYHLVLDTSLGSIEDTANVLIAASQMVKKDRKKRNMTTKP